MPIGLASSPLEVRIEIPDDLPPVEIDRAQIQLVLVNLLQEALDVLEVGTTPGQLRIAAAPGGGEVRITISLDRAGCDIRLRIASWRGRSRPRWSRTTVAPSSASRARAASGRRSP